MADDYESLKVPDLKKLLKDRSIPSTGITRKAQYIAALRKDDERALADAQNTTAADGEPDAVASVASSVTLPADDAQVEPAEPLPTESIEANLINDAPTTIAPEPSASSDLVTPTPSTQEVVGKCLT
jgi:hypothetical protein